MDKSEPRNGGKISLLDSYIGISKSFAELNAPADFTALASQEAYSSLQQAHAILKNRSLIFVDDQRDYLAGYVLPLQIATGGHASFLQVTQQSCEQLADRLIQSKADIILMDYFFNPQPVSYGARSSEDNLSRFNGADLVRELRSRQTSSYSPIIVGFSADGMFDEFARAGVNGATTKFDPVHKDIRMTLGFDPPVLSVLTVAQIVHDLNSKGREPSACFSVLNQKELGHSPEWFAHNSYLGKVHDRSSV